MTHVTLNFVVEGQSEETFVNEILRPHLAQCGVWAFARRVQTSRSACRIAKGGLSSFAKLRRDIEHWMKEDRRAHVYFTTMVDLYAYPTDAPSFVPSLKLQPYDRVTQLEKGLAEALAEPRRFIPYIQLHEFETLLFSDLDAWTQIYPEDRAGVARLKNEVRDFANIELINDNPNTAPSKRILKHITDYEKPVFGTLLALEIGLASIRSQCLHFDEWLTQLETLPIA